MKRLQFEDESGTLVLDLLFTDLEYSLMAEAAAGMDMTLAEFAKYAFSQAVSREWQSFECTCEDDGEFAVDADCPVHGWVISDQQIRAAEDAAVCDMEDVDPVRGAFDGY